MDEKALLEAISQLMDKKLDTVKQEMSSMMDEKLQANKETLRQEIMEDFNTVIENKVSKEIRLIAEQHGDIVKKLGRVNRIDDLENRISTLEMVIRKHTDDIRELQKAE